MTDVKMTIHEALREIKMLNKQIDAKIKTFQGVLAVPALNTKIGSYTIAEWETEQTAEFQSLMDLMTRRDALKQAISESNAKTMVEMKSLGRTLSVAALIDVQTSGLVYQRTLVNQMRIVYGSQFRELNSRNESASIEAANHARMTYSNSNDKDRNGNTAALMKKTEEDYYNAHKYELRDPLKIDKKIKEIEAWIDEVRKEADAKLSVSNATTILEFSYKNYGEA